MRRPPDASRPRRSTRGATGSRGSGQSTDTALGLTMAEGNGGNDANLPAALSKRAALAGGLYLVATPIGHADDITLRALDILGRADLVVCEDTRHSGRLLARHGIKARLFAYHDHNAEAARPTLLRRLAEGEALALISDAGTPLISDPGYKLVRACIDQGLPVTVVPGPSALLAALLLSGLACDRFLFQGFLPPRQAERRRALAELAEVPASLVFFESPQRLAESLADMALMLGDRQAAVARELTKLFEEVRRGRLGELGEAYRMSGPPKGEVTVVVGPAEAGASPALDLDQALRAALQHQSVRDAAATVAAATGLARRQVYARALALAQGDKP
jgi:16S rRNA (cytidine1402-2'-O)-methyltransferase